MALADLWTAYGSVMIVDDVAVVVLAPNAIFTTNHTGPNGITSHL